MNFNIDRISQLAGLSAGREGASTLNESAGRRARPATTYDRVVDELQVRGLELFYTPAQINEAIRSERRILSEERELELEGTCSKCGKKRCICETTDEAMGFDDEGHDMYEAEHHLDAEADEMMHMDADADEMMHMHGTDEGMDDLEAGTVVKTPKGGEFKVTKKAAGAAAGALAESKLRRIIDFEVARVLAEMREAGDTGWMYPDRKRPAARPRGATMGFAGSGFKR